MLTVHQLALKFAQQFSAQAGDIKTVLYKAGLWELGSEVAKLMSQAKVPENIEITINLIIEKNLLVNFEVISTPFDRSSVILTKLLTDKYALPMKTALQKAKINVADQVRVVWLKY